MHVREENLERYVLGLLSRTRSSSVRSHLAKCSACGDRLKKAVAGIGRGRTEPGKDRRREQRSHVDAPASRQPLDPATGRKSEIRVVDVSTSGLRLRVPELIEPGTVVQIRLRNTVATGEVRYCCPVGKQFDVGVQFKSVSPVV